MGIVLSSEEEGGTVQTGPAATPTPKLPHTSPFRQTCTVPNLSESFCGEGEAEDYECVHYPPAKARPVLETPAEDFCEFGDDAEIVRFAVDSTYHAEGQPIFPEMTADAPMHGVDRLRSASLTRGTLAHKRHLADGVVLSVQNFHHRTGWERRSYTVSNHKLSPLRFTVDLSDWAEDDACWSDTCGGSSSSARKRTIQVEACQSGCVGIAEERVALHSDGHEPQLHCDWKHFPGPDKLSPSTEIAEHLQDDVLSMWNNGISDVRLRSADAILQSLRRAGLLRFTDVSFPPSDKSICGTEPPKSSARLVWRRPGEIHKSKTGQLNLWGPDGIRPRNILPGAVGNSWFLAAVAALAEEPDLVKRLFSKPTASKEGVYEVTFWKNGEETVVIIDDWLPCCAATGAPCFSHTHNGDLWVALLEKAWAKLHGSYSNMEAGMPFQAMMDLCGWPGECLSFDQVKSGELLGMVDTLLGSGDLLVAHYHPTKHDQAATEHREMGRLVPRGQAFTILRTQKVCGETLVCMRNPWGSLEWNGEWRDTSLRWTEEAQAEANYVPEDDEGGEHQGDIFWMSEEEFLEGFTHVHVLHCDARGRTDGVAASHSFSLLGPLGEHEALIGVVEFQLEEAADGYCVLWQRDEKMPGSSAYKRMAVAVYGPIAGDSHEVARSNLCACRELVVRIPVLDPGSYWVAVWNCDVCPADRHNRVVLRTFWAPALRPVPMMNGSAPHSRQPMSVDLNDFDAKGFALDLTADRSVAPIIKGGVAQAPEAVVKHGDFLMCSGWLPDESFGIALRPLSHMAGGSLKVTLDFTGTTGARVVGAQFMSRPGEETNGLLSVCWVHPGEDWQQLASIYPTADKQRIRYQVSWYHLR